MAEYKVGCKDGNDIIIVNMNEKDAMYAATQNRKREFNPRPFREVAKARNVYSPNAKVSTENMVIGEKVLYTPGSRPVLLPASSINFYARIGLDKVNDDEMWVPHYDSKVLVAANAMEYFPAKTITVKTSDFPTHPLTMALFRDSSLAKDYAARLKQEGISRIRVEPLDKGFVDSRSKPFIRGMFLNGIPNGSSITADTRLGREYWSNLDRYRASA